MAALLVNGFIATVEDELPGGFNNPDGTQTPPYALVTVRIARWALAVLLWAFALAYLVTGLNPTSQAPVAFVVGIPLACLLFSVALLAKRRWALWAAIAMEFGGIAFGVLAR